MTAQQVVDSETGLAKNDSVRRSSGFFYELGEDEVRNGTGSWGCLALHSGACNRFD